MGEKIDGEDGSTLYQRIFPGVRQQDRLDELLDAARQRGDLLSYELDGRDLTVRRPWYEGQDLPAIFEGLSPTDRAEHARVLFERVSAALARLGDGGHGAVHPGNVRLLEGGEFRLLDAVANATRLGRRARGQSGDAGGRWLWGSAIPQELDVARWDRLCLLRLTVLLAGGPESWRDPGPPQSVADRCRQFIAASRKKAIPGSDLLDALATAEEDLHQLLALGLDVLAPPAPAEASASRYHYACDGEQQGELPAAEIARRVAAAPASDHRVWSPELGDRWRPAREVGAVARLIGGTAVPPAPPSPPPPAASPPPVEKPAPVPAEEAEPAAPEPPGGEHPAEIVARLMSERKLPEERGRVVPAAAIAPIRRRAIDAGVPEDQVEPLISAWLAAGGYRREEILRQQATMLLEAGKLKDLPPIGGRFAVRASACEGAVRVFTSCGMAEKRARRLVGELLDQERLVAESEVRRAWLERAGNALDSLDPDGEPERRVVAAAETIAGELKAPPRWARRWLRRWQDEQRLERAAGSF